MALLGLAGIFRACEKVERKISAHEAWRLIRAAAHPLASKKLSVDGVANAFVSKSILAPISLPPFDNSAVDGYALGRVGEVGDTFQVVATIGAGQCFQGTIDNGQACRIMTGAKIPGGTRAVAMQERVESVGAEIILKAPLAASENIRRAGEDVAAGTVVSTKGTRIGPRQIALLNALGIDAVDVFEQPTAAIISTGSELADPGQVLKEGQVYYCTGPMIKSLCHSVGVRVTSSVRVDDDENIIIYALNAVSSSDIIIMVGGMADGIYDHGRKAFAKFGVEPIFFEGKWRPGKPLFFGKRDNSLIFGLPGNPVAAFVMFKIFIEPAIASLSAGDGVLHWKKAKAAFMTPKPSEISQFQRGRLANGMVELLSAQGSHQLFSLSQANTIVWIEPNSANIDEVLYLPLEP